MRTRCMILTAAVMVGVMLPQVSHAQDTPRVDDLARDFNSAIGPINDGIDNLTKQLDNPRLTMDESAKIIDQQSALRSNADDLWNKSQERVSFTYKQTSQDITTYNNDNRKLEYSSAIIGSQNDVLGNVAKYPTKDQFEANKAQMSANWDQTYGSRLKPFGDDFAQQKDAIFKEVKDKYGIDMRKDGYDRVGTINPYTGEVYYKYYSKDGSVAYAQWQDDADGWNKYRQDSDTFRRRQLSKQEALSNDAAALNQFTDKFEASRQSFIGRLDSIGNRVQKINFAGNWSGNDNVGNWVRLNLHRNGTMSYSYGKTSTAYSSNGTWNQIGPQITMGTNDGDWTFESQITDQSRLQFTEINRSGRQFTNYLSR
jgi:hypothetical protein